MKQIDAAKTLIARDFNACRKPDIAGIAEQTGLQLRSVEVLADEVRAAMQTPRAPKPAPNRPATTTVAAPAAVVETAWLRHPSPRVQRAARRAIAAIDAVKTVIDAEGSVELWARRERLRAELAEVEAQLPVVVECSECGARIKPGGKAVHEARSVKHRQALAASRPVALTAEELNSPAGRGDS